MHPWNLIYKLLALFLHLNCKFVKCDLAQHFLGLFYLNFLFLNHGGKKKFLAIKGGTYNRGVKHTFFFAQFCYFTTPPLPPNILNAEASLAKKELLSALFFSSPHLQTSIFQSYQFTFLHSDFFLDFKKNLSCRFNF